MTSLLLAGAPEAVANSSASTDQPQAERKICRKQIETGSLIKGKKVCFTAKQWQKLADANREEVERTSSMGSSSGK
ncbi:hypothetical protein HJG53_14755 [Sphingomonas sp. ID1715]|uniref:hypothetical protein n=1 Tax=Sphingomonas sp. ID1715 TaxID=1656898 RepID=UPI0014895E61|nr:hypothetical protein [Sphingomonas sp. ID1715]NNM78156.1 hypothetical protein [Sphingomonas sp. ID1715]